MSVLSKPFRERNPFPIGLIGIGLIVVLLLAAFNVQSLPFIGSGPTYRAAFSEAGGLTKGAEVRVAGVKVGQVRSVGLEGDHVLVTFTVQSGTRLGSLTRASIRIKTLLGQKYLALEPDGPGRLAGSREIPLSRTTAPFDVPQAFSGLAQHIDDIDTDQLAKSFDTIATTFKNSPPEVRSALTGLSRLSHTVATRNDKLQELLQHAQGVTGVLAQRNQEITKLINDGDLLLRVIELRREEIHALLVNTQALSDQLVGLVRDNQAALAPALARLHSVLTILQRNDQNLDQAIKILAPFVRNFADTLGNGRWFDTIVAGLPPLPAGAGTGGTPGGLPGGLPSTQGGGH